jgi:hypothetical protein
LACMPCCRVASNAYSLRLFIGGRSMRNAIAYLAKTTR